MCKKKRNKFSIEDQERAVLKVINKGRSCNSVAIELHTSKTLIRRWVDSYKLHGINGLSLKNTLRYTGEFKCKLILEMLEQKLSLHQMSVKYNITHSVISNWRRDYEQHGASSLFKEKPRGRPPIMKDEPKKKNNITSTGRYDQLLDENLRLRAENDFLKKLHALMLKEEAQQISSELKSSKN
jgi:transposase